MTVQKQTGLSFSGRLAIPSPASTCAKLAESRLDPVIDSGGSLLDDDNLVAGYNQQYKSWAGPTIALTGRQGWPTMPRGIGYPVFEDSQ
jgi:hypothetical protein